MARPVLLLLDEPSMGLSPKLVEVIGSTLQRLRSDGLSPSTELRGNLRIRRLYLGLLSRAG